MTFCAKCGTGMEEGVNFCPNCGLELNSAVIDGEASGKETPEETGKPKIGMGFIIGCVLTVFGVALFHLLNRAYYSTDVFTQGDTANIRVLVIARIIFGTMIAAGIYLIAKNKSGREWTKEKASLLKEKIKTSLETKPFKGKVYMVTGLIQNLVQKIKTFIKNLPLSKLAEKHIPANAKEKFPALSGFVIPYANQIAAGLVAVLALGTVYNTYLKSLTPEPYVGSPAPVASSGGGGSSQQQSSSQQNQPVQIASVDTTSRNGWVRVTLTTGESTEQSASYADKYVNNHVIRRIEGDRFYVEYYDNQMRNPSVWKEIYRVRRGGGIGSSLSISREGNWN